MSVVVAAIAVFPVLTLLLIGLAKTENGLARPVKPRITPADLPVPAPETTVS
ncbi:hypothetical protein [Kineosporia succinea]|uniref:Uncharacterized protein n=1 Tax=Kineosporia succinea TaxID=84632 RepID=A0ABT9P1D3_9ACTN|nr:hypothetical protein [Kineosporia succinea]MDP9826483.1 hypothetical protein [Kineosporia succinea]